MKNIAKITFALSVALLSACATTSNEHPSKNWVYITGGQNNFGIVRYYIDPTTISIQPNGNRVGDTAEVYSYPKLYTDNKYLRGLVRKTEFSCSDPGTRTLSTKIYSDAQLTDLIGSYDTKHTDTGIGWQDGWTGGRRTNTIAEMFANFACDL